MQASCSSPLGTVLCFICRFVAGSGYNEQVAAQNKANLQRPCICVTTFNMIAHTGKRSAYGAEIMDLITKREWGLLLLDEVHVVPAKMFRRVSVVCAQKLAFISCAVHASRVSKTEECALQSCPRDQLFRWQ